jgi:hypothetical protein
MVSPPAHLPSLQLDCDSTIKPESKVKLCHFWCMRLTCKILVGQLVTRNSWDLGHPTCQISKGLGPWRIISVTMQTHKKIMHQRHHLFPIIVINCPCFANKRLVNVGHVQMDNSDFLSLWIIARPSWLARWWQTSTNNQDSHADSHFTVSNSCRRTGVCQNKWACPKLASFQPTMRWLSLSTLPRGCLDSRAGCPRRIHTLFASVFSGAMGGTPFWRSIPQPFWLGVLGLVDFKNDHLISGSQDLKLVKPRWEFRKTTVNVV